MIAKLFNAKLLAIVTNTNGVYKDKDDKTSRIKTISSKELTSDFIENICGWKSNWWTWWMASKLDVARQAWEIWENWEPWIPTYIFDGKSSTLLEYINRAKKWTFDEIGWGTIITP